VRFCFTGTEFLYDYNANLSKAVAAKRLPLTILCTASNSSRPSVSHIMSYKEMRNFGSSKTGPDQPLLPVVDYAMECEEVDVSRVDSPPSPAPVSAPCSPQAAPAQTKVRSTRNNTPVANPVELQLAAGRHKVSCTVCPLLPRMRMMMSQLGSTPSTGHSPVLGLSGH